MRFKRVLAALVALCLALALMPATASSKYTIYVDTTNQIVTIYDSGNISDSGIVRQMICSTGKSATPTPTGTFSLPAKSRSSERSEWYYFPEYNCYAKWATRIRGGILFHSVLYSASKKGPTSSSVKALGTKASHGCIRLRVEDAKFIAQNCPVGTKCKIYASGKTDTTLKNKLKSKTFSRDNQTYESFTGRASAPAEDTGSKLPLKKGSKGTLVTKLQTRLKELGFLSANVTGTMVSSTVTAVQAFEAAAGLAKTKKVDQALWNRIFADDAPTGMLVTLSQGSRGPAVAVLQRNLITLKLLDDKADGVFGSKTDAALRLYQQTFGSAVTGSADTALQQEIAGRAAGVKATFGDSDYALTEVTTEVQMARVNVKSSLKMRSKPSSSGSALAKLKNGAKVEVLSVEGNWAKVIYGKYTGYLNTAYLTLYTEEVTRKEYVEVAAPTTTPEVSIPTETPSIPTETPSIPTQTPSIPTETPSIPTETPSIPTASPTAKPVLGQATVVAASGVIVYDRPVTKGAMELAFARPGDVLEVLEIGEEWLMVRFDGAEGYVQVASVKLDADVPAAEANVEWVYGTEPTPEPTREPDYVLEIETEPIATPAPETFGDGGEQITED